MPPKYNAVETFVAVFEDHLLPEAQVRPCTHSALFNFLHLPPYLFSKNSQEELPYFPHPSPISHTNSLPH